MPADYCLLTTHSSYRLQANLRAYEEADAKQGSQKSAKQARAATQPVTPHRALATRSGPTPTLTLTLTLTQPHPSPRPST